VEAMFFGYCCWVGGMRQHPVPHATPELSDWSAYRAHILGDRDRGKLSPVEAQERIEARYRDIYGIDPTMEGAFAYGIKLYEAADAGDLSMDEADTLARARIDYALAHRQSTLPLYVFPLRRRTDMLSRMVVERQTERIKSEEIMMKTLSALLIGTFCVGLSAQGMAALQANAANAADTSPPTMKHDSTEVRTSDVGYAAPDLLKLDPQAVVSQGGSLRPGPHNRHFQPPHGGPVTAGDRSEIPGRE
jgi:hypothetical protein